MECRSAAPSQPHQAEPLTLACPYTMGPGAVFLLYSMLGFIFLPCHPTKSLLEQPGPAVRRAPRDAQCAIQSGYLIRVHREQSPSFLQPFPGGPELMANIPDPAGCDPSAVEGPGPGEREMPGHPQPFPAVFAFAGSLTETKQPERNCKQSKGQEPLCPWPRPGFVEKGQSWCAPTEISPGTFTLHSPRPLTDPWDRSSRCCCPGTGLGQRGTGGDSGTAPLTDLH